MNGKKSIIELWRFIAAIVIVLHHAWGSGISSNNFITGWIFVDFFFMLTGYFTMVHFCKTEQNENDIVKYSVKKYMSFIPYTTIALLSVNIIQILSSGFDIKKEIDLLMEMTIIFAIDNERVIDSFWFLSALMIVFPAFCLLCKTKNKNILYVISFSCIALFYGAVGIYTNYAEYPLSLLRAFSTLCIGIGIFGISEKLKEINVKRSTKIIFTLIEACLFLFVLFGTFTNRVCYSFMILCLFLGILLVMSNITYSSTISNSVLNYLGKISLLIYIFHQPVIAVFKYFNINLKYGSFVLITITIAISIFLDAMALLFRKIKTS